jgi:hypothetical protein
MTGIKSKKMRKGWLLWIWAACLVQGAPREQFVELTTEIEVEDWSYWFWRDPENLKTKKNAPSIFRTGMAPNFAIRCVVGTNGWLMEGPFSSNAKVAYWFTGSNIVKRSEITSEIPEAELKRRSKIGPFALGSPKVGTITMRTNDSVDGNPGRPVRVVDVLMTAEKVVWLAFCSAPVLRGENPQIPLPSDLWKQYLAKATFTNEVIRFKDSLGLPSTMVVSTASGQMVFQYQVHHSTNVLGWNFPTEFYMVQYKPAGWPRTNSWEMQMTAKGRVTAIGPGKEPGLAEGK